MYVEENNGAKAAPKKSDNAPVSTDEKAQYEVFRNGELPRDQIAEWINNDLKATLSFISGALNDSEINNALVDAYYNRYKKLHAKNVEGTTSETGN